MPDAAKTGVTSFAQGDGPGLLCIHGAGGNAAIWWQQVEAFAKTHRVAAYDLAGFGTSRPLKAEDLPQCLAGDAVSVLDNAGIPKASVIGHSLGGWSALRLALEYPERVEKLVLSCSMGGVVHMPALQSYVQSTGQMDSRGPASLALTPDFEQAHPAKAYVYRQISASNPPLPKEALQALFAPTTLVPPERLSEIRCPVLILAGAEDPIWPAPVLEGLLDHLPNCELDILPGTGHSPYFERPAAYNQRLADFLQQA